MDSIILAAKQRLKNSENCYCLLIFECYTNNGIKIQTTKPGTNSRPKKILLQLHEYKLNNI